MSEKHESGCFPCGWWRRKEETKRDTSDHSKNSAQESNVKEVEVLAAAKQSVPVKDMITTERRLSGGPDEVEATNDGDPTSVRGILETTTEATIAQESSAENVKSDEPASEIKSAKDVPTNMEYATEATKKALAVLKGIADIVKFPLVKEIIELGIAILDTCQTISDVKSGVQRLRDRITCLLLSVADATKEAQESDRLIKDLEELKKCLGTIMGRLKSIASQNAFKSSFLSEPNMKMISDCEKDFQDSVERFQILRSLEMGQGIILIQRQLDTFKGVSLNMAENVEDIKHEVNEMKSDIKTILIGMKSSKPMDPSVYIPQLASPLFGRQEIVQRIVGQLSRPDGARICILGPGGMGKTSTALAVINDDRMKATFGEYRYWVPCIQGNSIDNFIAILSRHLKAEKRTGDPLDDIVATLQEGDKRRVILLDNFETPCQRIPNVENTIQPILSRLDSIPNISILLTMRSEWAPSAVQRWHCEKLEPIKSEESQSLYVSIHPDSCKYPDQLKELLDALGHMPYAITLMASRGKRSGADPGKLLKEWRQKGTDMLSRKAEGINWCIELSVESSYVRESEDALRTLQILSMLPAGVNQQDLSIWAGEWSSQAIETLRDTALIITRPVSTGEDSTVDHHFVLPVVQSYMAQKGRIPPEVREAVLGACYQFLMENNATVEGPNDPSFKKHLAAIASQEANLQAILTDLMKEKHPLTSMPLSPSNHLDALLVYINYQRWARPRPEIAEQVISLARTVAASRQEAVALFCLGHILVQMAKEADADQAFESAHIAFERIGDDSMAFQSQLEQFRVDVHWDASFIDPWEALNDIRRRWENASSVNPTFCAWLSYYEGYLHWFDDNSKEATEVSEEAAEGFNRLGLSYERSDGLYIVARSYAGLQNFSAALHHIDLVITLQNHLFGEGFKTPDIVNSLLMRVRYLKGMGRWDEEMETTLAGALEASRELGLSRSILLLLEELGEVYVRKGDLVGAREAYEEAIRKGHGSDNNTSRNAVRRVENNMDHIDYLWAKSQGSDSMADWVPFSRPARY